MRGPEECPLPIELGQLKRQLKDLEERMSSLRGFL
jgi:hypothetical protein